MRNLEYLILLDRSQGEEPIQPGDIEEYKKFEGKNIFPFKKEEAKDLSNSSGIEEVVRTLKEISVVWINGVPYRKENLGKFGIHGIWAIKYGNNIVVGYSVLEEREICSRGHYWENCRVKFVPEHYILYAINKNKLIIYGVKNRKNLVFDRDKIDEYLKGKEGEFKDWVISEEKTSCNSLEECLLEGAKRRTELLKKELNLRW